MTNDRGASGQGQRLGMVVAGSLSDGVDVRLDLDASIEDIKVGAFVTIQGKQMRFFGVVTDVSLRSTDPMLSASPVALTSPLSSKPSSAMTEFSHSCLTEAGIV